MSVVGSDGRPRCAWAGHDPLLIRYHDQEWGVPPADARAAFEHLALETMQAGLSWRVVLGKRAAFRSELDGLDPERLAERGEADVDRWVRNPALIRNRAKLRAVLTNARAFLELEGAGPGLQSTLDAYLTDADRRPSRAPGVAAASAVPASRRAAAALKARGFRFVGPTVLYAHMQATGLVRDHDVGCFRRATVEDELPFPVRAGARTA